MTVPVHDIDSPACMGQPWTVGEQASRRRCQFQQMGGHYETPDLIPSIKFQHARHGPPCSARGAAAAWMDTQAWKTRVRFPPAALSAAVADPGNCAKLRPRSNSKLDAAVDRSRYQARPTAQPYPRRRSTLSRCAWCSDSAVSHHGSRRSARRGVAPSLNRRAGAKHQNPRRRRPRLSLYLTGPRMGLPGTSARPLGARHAPASQGVASLVPRMGTNFPAGALVCRRGLFEGVR